MQSYSELVVRYRYVRDLGRSMGRDLMKRLGKDMLDEGGRDLGFLRKGIFVFDSEDEGALLFDYCIFNIRREGRNVVQMMLAENFYPNGSEEANHVRSMNESWYSLFTIERVEPGVGVHVLDAIRKTTHLLIDLGLSQTGQPGDMMASRVVPLEGFIMTTGACLPLSTALGIRGNPVADVVRTFVNKNNSSPRQLSAEQERSLARSIISGALSTGLTRRVRYKDAGEPIDADDLLLDEHELPGRPLVPVRTGGRIGRNDPCVCGSGRKYKHCCGKG